MKLTALFVPAEEGGFSCYIEEIPGAISEGETLEGARENLTDALRMVLAANRELANRDGVESAIREQVEWAAL